MKKDETTDSFAVAFRTAAGKAQIAAALESPFGKAISRGDISVPSYVEYLRALTAVHGFIERHAQRSADSLVSTALVQSTRKLPLLHHDLLFYRYQLVPDQPRVVTLVLDQVARLRRRSMEGAAALVGYLCAAAEIAVAVAPWHAAMVADPRWSAARAYAEHCVAHAMAERETLRMVLDRQVRHQDQIATAIAAAGELWAWFHSLADALEPTVRETPRYHSFSLNPESGNHPVCQTAAELRAVLHANDRCIAEYPYYVYRYGASAYFYGDVDGAWLATLPHLGPVVLQKQVQWIAELLAARGMPTFLQARHLHLLADELDAELPAQGSLWAMLRDAAVQLNPVVPSSLGIGVEFAAQDAARIINGARHDAQQGLTEGLPGVIAWFSDPTRFTAEWIEAVKTLAASPSESAAHPSAAILLIDDDDLYRAVIHRWLTRAGYTVHQARDGREGLKVLQQTRFELVVTDIMMPEMDGLEVVRQLAERSDLKGIIAMSSHVIQEGGFGYLDAAADFGADAVFRKPVERERFLAEVQRLLGEAGA